MENNGCNIKWTEINTILHQLKNDLMKTVKIENDARELRQKIGQSIDLIYKVVNNVVDDNNDNSS